MPPNEQTRLNDESSDLQPAAWCPVLEGALKESALEAIRAIAAALPKPSSAESFNLDPSLVGGKAGLAVLYAYLAHAGLGDDFDETAVRFLEQAIDAVSVQPMPPALYGGFTGIAWATEHLQGGPLDFQEDDPNETIDDALRDYLSRSPWPGEYDLVNGLVGLGVYALERLQRPTGVECLELVIERLEETAERNAEGVTWFTPSGSNPLLQQRFPQGHYNVGLAHGVPGVIALLGEACAAGVSAAKARPLLDGAVNWLLSQKLTPTRHAGGRQGSYFPYCLAPDRESIPARLAWCYGDPGVATALLYAARRVGETAWEREALGIAREMAERPFDRSGVVDVSLCHGAAGLGHIFNRWFQATGEELFKQAAQFWFGRTLELRLPDQGVAGFAYWQADEDGGGRWVSEPGLLEGAAGVALALLSAATPTAPEWDRVLLVSIPPRTAP